MALSVPLSRFTSRVGGGSAFYVRRLHVMQIGDTKSLMKGVITLCIVVAVVMVVDFGSFYLGRYGFSFPQKDDGLRQIFCHDLVHAFSPGMIAATMVYFAAKKKNESKSKPAV